MREAINFTFDGIASEDMGVIIASPNGGLYNEAFLPNRSIVETSVSKRNKRYLQRVELEPLSFSLSFFIEGWRDRDNLRQIARWLMKDYYKALTFETNPDRIFYAMVEGDSNLIHNGCKDGYIELNIRCNSPYTYSPLQTVGVFDVIATETLSVLNSGDISIKPIIRVTKRNSNGSVSIKVEETGQTLTIDNLQTDEEVFIDCENSTIVSELEYLNVYHYANHNDEWLELNVGENTLKCTGEFDIEIEYQAVYLTD